MKSTLTIFALAITASVFSQGIQFIEVRTDSDMTVITQRMNKENKLILIDCYTEWCGPCKWMEKNVFTNDTVAKFFNENFICARMDMEKGIGISRTYKYEIYSYPTMLFFGEKTTLHRAIGAKNVKEMIELGETALNPEKRFSFWQKKYLSGNREPHFIREYLKQLKRAGLKTQEITDWYFTAQNGDELLNKENLEIILNSRFYPENKTFQFFFRNRKKFEAFTENKKSVSDKIYNTYFKACIEAIENKDTLRYRLLTDEIAKSEYERADELSAFLKTQYYSINGEHILAVNAFIEYVNEFLMTIANTSAEARVQQWIDLNDYAWMLYEDSLNTDNALLEQALSWSKKSIEINSNYYNHDTYAALLYKLGRKKEALKAAEKAIELGKKAGEDVSGTEELVKMIKG